MFFSFKQPVFSGITPGWAGFPEIDIWESLEWDLTEGIPCMSANQQHQCIRWRIKRNLTYHKSGSR